MQLDPASHLPLFEQIAEALAEGIVSGAYPEDTQVPSTTEISTAYQVNPATVLKGMNLLVARGQLYKRRGLGMFVAVGARASILAERRRAFRSRYLAPLLAEAEKLGLSSDDVIALLKDAAKEATDDD